MKYGTMIFGLCTAAALLSAGCGAHKSALPTSTASRIQPANFVARVDNPWFPLTPGTTYVYQGVKDHKPARDVLAVTHQTKLIQGVRCITLHDRLFLSGRLHERTTDWYAQDKDGNVWYFGESTAELDKNGKVTSTEGTWQSGRDGAVAGIYIPGRPHVGQSMRQEFYKGHAEDHFQVVSLSASVRVPYTTSTHALLTKEWTPLEPGAVDHKLYVRGIGVVKEETIRGGNERDVLISVRHR